MAHRVKQLASMSGVSVRTLHWYDSQGLLAPAYVGANGYRYYEEEQLLMLQQILFFKELGFPLGDIQRLLTQEGFDKVKALKAHRKTLVEDVDRTKTLINTIDKTLLRLEGENIMTNEELYYGFDSSRQAEYEQYIVKHAGTKAEDALFESKRRTAKWDKDEWDNVKAAGDQIYKDLAVAIEKGLSPENNDVQEIIRRHFELQNRFFDLTKDVYIGLPDLYAGHPDFRKFFDAYHPEMVEYISQAMRFYAKENL
ncbi:MAG: MerR family transcriptional regulator [Coxiellaceae bacterium]|nr:MerR family transcriptional regulator [Coxiellaceae bacterium]